MAMRRSHSQLLRRALANDVATPRLLFTRVAGFKSWPHLSNDRSWPSPDGGSGAPSGPAYPETGSTSSRDLDGAKPAAGDDKFVSGSSKPGTGRTWPNPNAPRDIPTYTPSSYSSSSKGGGKLWDNPNGLPYWDSKWDDPTKPELRAKGWTWDPNPANSHMGTWPADQPPPNRSPLGFGTPRGGSTWNRGGGGGGGNWNQGGGGGGGNWNQGGGGGGGAWNQGGGPGGGGGGFAPQGNQQGGAPGGGGFPGGNQQGGGGFPGGNQQGGGTPGGGGFPGGPGGGGFPGGNQQGGAPGGGAFPGGNQQGGAAPAGGGFPSNNNQGGGFNR